MFSFLILVSGKNIEYSQAVGKRCSEKATILKKPALKEKWRFSTNSQPVAKILENKRFLFHRQLFF